MARNPNIDTLLQWPAISMRIYGHRKFVFVDAGKAFKGNLTRSDAARMIIELRKKLREFQGDELI